jgi:RNA polymerase sigma-70 factor (ECF subfamily)
MGVRNGRVIGQQNLEAELEKLHPASFTWALACCGGDPLEAEEALQTSYLKVLDQRARFNGRSSLKTWFFSVIRRTAWGQRRLSLARRLILARWSNLEPRQNPFPSPEHQLRQARNRSRVARALAELSARQRQVLELVFFHDLSIGESAVVLGVTVGTARTHYERGKRALLEHLQEVER